MCLRCCTNATCATLVLQALYPHWLVATFPGGEPRGIFSPLLQKVGGFFFFFFFFFFPFSWGDVEFEMLMAQKSLPLLSLFMVLFEGKNFPACGWDNREMLSGGIFHSTWPYAIKGQFGHTSQWTWRHQSFAGLMWKSKCFNSSQVKLLPPNCLSLHLPSHL